MRLEKVKLAGFKSFVDPTVLPLPSNLVGIVGPNGCGKSNLIDAVRWVMGESSAKHLRGESMSDVVFNGSSTRKPVTQASVELVFDNSDGSAPGEFAKYAQISVRRQVTRDGQSSYFLNGSRCRRKDITDIFLGTGLGPRSYAIIEQGTISRLIEAKPEEMRGFIEEAAGISKYKERRHETEIRMRHTRENLDRLNDLRDEVAKQLGNLQRQAKKAEKYLALRDEERRYRRELLALRWRQYDRHCQEQQQTIAGLVETLSELGETGRELDLAQEQRRAEYSRLQQAVEQTQGRFYGLSADIGRLEQSIRGTEKNRAEMEKELQRLETEAAQAARELAGDREQLEDAREELLRLEQACRTAQALEAEAAGLREAAAGQHSASQQRRDAAKAESARHGQQSEVQRTRLRHLAEDAGRLAARRQRLDGERGELLASLDREGLEELQQEVAELELARSDARATIQELEHSLQAGRERLKTLRDELHAARSESQQVAGRVASLELLQQHAMGKDNGALAQWLAQSGLAQAPRLAECLEVRPGWETAVEKVLDRHLQALCVDDLPGAAAQMDALQGQALALVASASAAGSLRAGAQESAGMRLSEQVASPWALDGLLGSVYCAPDLAAAQNLAASLAPHESVVTPDGVRLGTGWLLLQRDRDERSGVLQREKELRALREARRQLAERCSDSEARIAELEQARREQESRRAELQQREHSLAAGLGKRQAELAAARTRLEQAEKRLNQLHEELAEIAEGQHHNGEEKAEAELLLAQAEQGWNEHQARLAAAEAEVAAAQERLLAGEQQARAARENLHSLNARRDTLASSQELTAKHLERLQQHSRQAGERIDELRERLAGSEVPMLQEREELAELLQQRADVEAELARARQALEQADQALRKLAEQRGRAEQDSGRVREKLEKARVEIQAMLVRRQTQQEQLAEADEQLETVLEQLPEDAEDERWQARVAELQDEIQRLGAINLTAVEEHQAQSERAAFLEQQHDDLSESLATLEQAIATIDTECKNRFKETFDRVNSGLQRKFPTLFGGGNAYLELHDQDLLNSGVTVMARPPGKRNSSIHLLSGGEKALTAVALVFSIFELNPAPFCLLDEVDAPLDEANVGRFSQLVKEMSEAVQFLFITHNKGTMEIAEQLAGVTMKEPGVSRIVAVDIEKAVELAGA